MSETTQMSPDTTMPPYNAHLVGACFQIMVPVPEEFIQCIIKYIGSGYVRIVMPPYDVINIINKYTSYISCEEHPAKRVKIE